MQEKTSPLIKPYIQNVLKIDLHDVPETELGPKSGELINQFRPEIDIYYVTDTALGNIKDSTLKLTVPFLKIKRILKITIEPKIRNVL